jgi:hypothetical protein
MIDLSTVDSLSCQVLRSGGYNREIWAMFARGNRDEEGVAWVLTAAVVKDGRWENKKAGSWVVTSGSGFDKIC